MAKNCQKRPNIAENGLMLFCIEILTANIFVGFQYLLQNTGSCPYCKNWLKIAENSLKWPNMAITLYWIEILTTSLPTNIIMPPPNGLEAYMFLSCPSICPSVCLSVHHIFSAAITKESLDGFS